MSSIRNNYQQKQRLFAAESMAIIAVNLLLAIAAAVAVVRLVTYNFSQQKTVEILDAEVADTEERVGNVREEFSQYFDPQQTKAIMRQRSHRIEAGQARIVLIEPESFPRPETPGMNATDANAFGLKETDLNETGLNETGLDEAPGESIPTADEPLEFRIPGSGNPTVGNQHVNSPGSINPGSDIPRGDADSSTTGSSTSSSGATDSEDISSENTDSGARELGITDDRAADSEERPNQVNSHPNMFRPAHSRDAGGDGWFDGRSSDGRSPQSFSIFSSHEPSTPLQQWPINGR